MTKKHYEMIAETIRCRLEGLRGPSYEAIKLVAQDLCIDFESDNPRFNRDMFLTACGIES